MPVLTTPVDKVQTQTFGFGTGLGVGDLAQQQPGLGLASILPYVGEPGISGVRLEDNIIVTENGFDVISRFPFDDRLLRV